MCVCVCVSRSHRVGWRASGWAADGRAGGRWDASEGVRIGGRTGRVRRMGGWSDVVPSDARCIRIPAPECGYW